MTRGTITLLHGFMGAPSDWDEIREEFPGYNVITPQIRPAKDWDAGLRQLIDELPTRSTWIGYSMGARLLLGCALAEPDACERLIFVSGNPGIEEASRDVRYQNDCQIADRIEREPRRDFLGWWYSQRVFESLTPQLREQEIVRKSAYDGDDWSDILRAYSVAKQPSYWERLDKLAMPTLAIAGIHDTKYVEATTRMGRNENIETRIVPASGHIVHHEQPLVFLHIVREFLESRE